MNELFNRLNMTTGNIVRLLADATAVGIVAFSVKPIYEALKGREWNTLPIIGVPFLLGTYILSERTHNGGINYIDLEESYDLVVEDFGELYSDLVHGGDYEDYDYDEEEAEGVY